MKTLSMLTLAKWHIWLGWLVGVPIAMWLATGLLMVSRPIEEVRGNHLRRELSAAPLNIPGSTIASADADLKEMRVVMQNGRAVAILTQVERGDGQINGGCCTASCHCGQLAGLPDIQP